MLKLTLKWFLGIYPLLISVDCLVHFKRAQPFDDVFVTMNSPPRIVHMSTSHGHPLERAHCSTSKSPPHIACEHVNSSHRQPPARSNFNLSSCPLLAAA